MVIPKPKADEIERHFFHISADVDLLEAKRQAIIDATRPLDPTGCHGRGIPGDPTGNAVAALDAMAHTLERWLHVVYDTYAHFRQHVPHEDMMRMYYAEHRRQGDVCRRLRIGRSTFYTVRSDVLTYAALKCAEYNIMSF